MDIAWYILLFFAGASMGSFVSVLLERLPMGQADHGRRGGIVAGRSECPQCRATLAWYDLLPIVSFILLARHCRSCGTPIPWMYFCLELAFGLSAAAFAWQQGSVPALDLAFGGIMLAGLLALFFFDYRYFILPDAIVIPFIILAAGYRIFEKPESLLNVLITAFLLSGIFAILYIMSHGHWIGFGDVKLVFLLGLIFGSPVGPAVVVFSIWLAAAIGAVLLAMRRATSQTALPFGSFLALVSIVFIIFHHEPSFITRFFL